MSQESIYSDLVGKKVAKIFINQDYLRFVLDDGSSLTYEVLGGCCSRSIFYDFIGAKKLLENGKVISVREIDLGEDDHSLIDMEVTKFYGVEFVTENKDFGEQTSVLSFRNYSNGFYGGWIQKSDFKDKLPELTEDSTHIE